MTDTIEIAGREWPVRFTLRALSKFENKFKLNALALSDPAKLSSEAACYLIWCGIEAGAKAEGEAFEMKPNELLDELNLSSIVQAFQILTAEVVGEKKA